MPVYVLVATLVFLGYLAAEAATPCVSTDGLSLTLSTVGASVSGALRRRRGRPRKFAAPSRAVTVTLPETVLTALSSVDPDISRAIVRLTQRRGSKNGHAAAELSVFGRRAVITVKPYASLAERTGIELVPLPDGRALIAFDAPRSIANLELRLNDALEDRQLPAADRQLFEEVLQILRDARRSDDVSVLQRSIIVLEAAKRSGQLTAAPGARTKK